MCTEAVAQCPVCFNTETIMWKYCMPYLKTSLEVRRQDEGTIPPASWFTKHKPAVGQNAVRGLSSTECPNAACPSKVPPEEEKKE